MINKPRQKIFRVITLPFLTTHVTSSSCESYYVYVENNIIAWPIRTHSISSIANKKKKNMSSLYAQYFPFNWFHRYTCYYIQHSLVLTLECMFMSLSLFWKDFLMAIQYHGLTYLSVYLFFYLKCFLILFKPLKFYCY